MRPQLSAIAAILLLAGGAVAQEIHPPTKPGAESKPATTENALRQGLGSKETEQSRGGADSPLNRDYGKDTAPEGKELHEGQPPKP